MVSVKSVLLVWFSRLATMFTSFALIPILHSDLTQEAFITALFFQAIHGWGQLTDLGTSTRNRNLIHSKLKVKYVLSSVVTLFLILNGGVLLISVLFYFSQKNYFFQGFFYLSIILFAGYSEHLVRLLYSKGVRDATSVVGLISCFFTLTYSYVYDFSSVLEFLCVFYLPAALLRFLLFGYYFNWSVFYFSFYSLVDNVIKSKSYFVVNLLGVVSYYSFPMFAEVFIVEEVLAVILVLNRVYFSGYSLFSSLIQMYWPVFTKLYESGDIVRVQLYVNYIGVFFTASIVVASALLFYNQELLFSLLMPGSGYRAELLTLVFFAFFYSCRVYSEIKYIFFQSIGSKSVLLKALTLQALISVLGQLCFVYFFGAEGLLLGLIVSLLPVIVLYNKEYSICMKSAHCNGLKL